MRQFLGIDLGTSAVKCLAVDESGTVLAKTRRSYPRLCPKPGYIEQDPADWWESVKLAVIECLSQLESKELAAISLSGHMSAPVLLDGENRVLANAILIADTRSAQETQMLRASHAGDFLKSTGNMPIDAFAVSKLLWMRNNRPELCEKIRKVIFPKDYIRLMLTGEVATDPTDAGNTLLYNFKEMTWNKELIEKVGLPSDWFPRLEKSAGVCGTVTGAAASATGLTEGIPVVCGASDMACSQIGSGGFSKDVIALTLSTSIQVVTPVSGTMEAITGKLTYHPSALPGSIYAMSSIFSGGMSVDWLYKLLNNTGSIAEEQYADLKQAIQSRYDECPLNSIVFLPFLTGSGSPWFDAADRGGFYGMSPDTRREDLVLSVFEGIGYNIRDNIELIESAVGNGKSIHLAGGGSMFPAWPQILANLLERPIRMLRQKDVSPLGAVILAGVGIGAFDQFADCFEVFNKVERTVEPVAAASDHYRSKYRLYQRIHGAIRDFNDESANSVQK